jgi:hypothetical protein
MFGKLLRDAVYCHMGRLFLRGVEQCTEVFDHSGRMISIMAVLGSDEFGLRI